MNFIMQATTENVLSKFKAILIISKYCLKYHRYFLAVLQKLFKYTQIPREPIYMQKLPWSPLTKQRCHNYRML